MLVSYVVKKKSGKRNILMLTTMHKSVKITRDSRKKPNVITLYKGWCGCHGYDF